VTHFEEKKTLFEAAGEAEAALGKLFYLIPRCKHERIADADAVKIYEAIRFLQEYRHNALLPNSSREDKTDGCTHPFCKKIRMLSKG